MGEGMDLAYTGRCTLSFIAGSAIVYESFSLHSLTSFHSSSSQHSEVTELVPAHEVVSFEPEIYMSKAYSLFSKYFKLRPENCSRLAEMT
jgi:hypothetical protein